MPRVSALLLALAALVTTGLAPAASAQIPEPDDDPFYAVPADVASLADGAVIRSRAIDASAMSIPMPATAWQVLYRTTDNTGTPTATVTTIMVPTADWTGSGPRPVVSYQTAEDGVGTKCAPSYAIRGGLQASASNSAPETLLMLQALNRGWTVVAPDYQGPRSMFLGAEGEARGVLDSLRAARAFAPAGIDPAAPLGLWGYSGGAFASTSAAQMQPRHAPELKLAGVALGGVVADLRATIHAFSGSAFGGALVMGFVAVDRSYPEYKLTRYLNDKARAAMAGSQTDCINDAVGKYPLARLEDYTDRPELIGSEELRPMFERINPLTFPGVPAAPVYEYHAQLDELAPIGPARKLIERFCRAGVPVHAVEDPINEHLSYVAVGATGAMDYLGDRFAGKPAPNTCKVPPDPVAPAVAPRLAVAIGTPVVGKRGLVVPVRCRGAAGRCIGRVTLASPGHTVARRFAVSGTKATLTARVRFNGAATARVVRARRFTVRVTARARSGSAATTRVLAGGRR
jgi:hypothetical protein